MTPLDNELRLEHEGCSCCDVAIRAVRGSRKVVIYDRRTKRDVLILRIGENGSWFQGAIARAFAHAGLGASTSEPER